MRRRSALVLGAGVGVAGAAAAGPVLDRMIARREAALNPVGTPPPYAVGAEAGALHASLEVVDLHADSLLFGRDLLRASDRGHLDLPRMRAGNLALEVFSAAVKTPAGLNIHRNDDRTDDVRKLALAGRWPRATWGSLLARALHLAGRLHAFAERSDGRLRVVRTAAELRAFRADRARDPGVHAGILSIEGAHALDGDPANLDAAIAAGYRMVSPAHFFDTAFGGSAHGVEQHGLTPRGRELVRRMEDAGLVVDVAHASARTIDDVLAMASRPVVASHTGVRGTCDNPRNLTDEHVRGIAATGGLVGIGFWDTAVGGTDTAAIARAIRYVADLVGVRHVALGSDFDGAVPVPWDVAGLPLLTESLLTAGFAADEVRAIMGGNALRVLEATLPDA